MTTYDALISDPSAPRGPLHWISLAGLLLVLVACFGPLLVGLSWMAGAVLLEAEVPFSTIGPLILFGVGCQIVVSVIGAVGELAVACTRGTLKVARHLA